MRAYRVSHVEAFRKWEMDDEADTETLIENICGWSEPSQAMKAGTAFHKALEHAQAGTFEELKADGFSFWLPDQIEIQLPEVREVRSYRRFMVDGEPISITGQVDAIAGRTVWDHKTTGRFDPERYIEGYQWRLYLEIFEADRFVWNVFEIAPHHEGSMDYAVKSFHSLEQFRYPTLGQDCQRLVERFARFVRERIEEPAWHQ